MSSDLKNPVAKQVDGDGERPILAHKASKAEGRAFYCYECDGELVLHKESSDGKRQNFKHKGQGPCGGYGQTTEHIAAKCLLAEHPEKFKFWTACRTCQKEIKELTVGYQAGTFDGAIEFHFQKKYFLDAALFDKDTGQIKAALEVYKTHEVPPHKAKDLTEVFGKHYNEVRADEVLELLRKRPPEGRFVWLLCMNRTGLKCAACIEAAARKQQLWAEEMENEAARAEQMEKEAEEMEKEVAWAEEMEKEAKRVGQERIQQEEREKKATTELERKEREARRHEAQALAKQHARQEAAAAEEQERRQRQEWEADRPRREAERKEAADRRRREQEVELLAQLARGPIEWVNREGDSERRQVLAERRNEHHHSHEWVEKHLPLCDLTKLHMTRVCANCPAQFLVVDGEQMRGYLRTVEFEVGVWKSLLAHKPTRVTFRHWTVCADCLK